MSRALSSHTAPGPSPAALSPQPPAAAPAGPAQPLRCQVLTDWEQAEPLAGAWDSLVQQIGGDIYFTYDWCRTWWRHYGGASRMRILVFREGEALAGVLPLVIDRLRLGPVPVQLARLLGSCCTTIVLNPPVAAGRAEAIYGMCLRHLLEEDGCDAAWFGPLAGHRSHRQALRRACESLGGAARIVRDRDSGVHTIFHLPETFEQYLAMMDKSQRGYYRRSRQALEKRFALRVDRPDDPDRLAAGFEEFIALHTTQWRSQGMLGHFGDWPGAKDFNRDLVRTLAPQGRLLLERLCVDGQAVACEYSYRLGDWLYWRLPARRAGEPWDRLGIGRISLLGHFQTAIEAGVRHVEGGAGHYDYKLRLGATEYPLGSMLIAAGRALAGTKAKMLGRWGDLLHLLYYRIWFSRVAPRLPLPRRPLWASWMRSHV